MKNTYFKSFLYVAVFLLSIGMYAQTISGVVTSEDGPLPGAAVQIKGTNTGVSTDFDGNFSIEAGADDTLVISFVGFATQEVLVGDQDQITVTLEVANLLEEVIVTTGYGTQEKRDVTGAVTVIDAEDLVAIPATTFAQQLQGRASGVNIINDATPGGEATVRIRGFGTVGNNNPLYVIDGVPSDSQSNLNPNDIETIQVLKDASAASIYGARAGNGVIVITTKKGKLGKPKITFSTYHGTQNTAEDVDALNARDLGEYLYFADVYAGKTPSHGQYTFPSGPAVTNPTIGIPNYVFPSGAATADLSKYSLTPDNIYAITEAADTNWWEEVTRENAPIKSYQVEASGATEDSRYAFTMGYFSQDGVINFVSFDRMSLRLNTSFDALDDKLQVGENFTITLGNRKGGFGNNSEQNAVSGSYKHHPLLPVYDVAGNFAGSRGLNLGNNYSPYATIYRNQDDRTFSIRMVGNAYASYEIIPDLTVKTSFGIDLATDRRRDIGRPQPEYVEGNFINSSSQRSSYNYQWVFTNTVNWAKTFGVHDIEVLAGIEAIEQFGEYFGAGRSRFPFQTNDIISYLDLGDATTSSNYGNVSTDYSLWSQFMNANYAYDDKYLLSVTVRNDASSRFKAATNSALFPAASVGWRISEEDFFPQGGLISTMKVRYGWGVTGNQAIGDYNAFTTYRSNIYNSGYPITGAGVTIGFDAPTFGNEAAQWETTTTNNVGVDMALLDSKLTVELDIWDRKTTDMLLQVPITFTNGDAAAPAINIGGVTNTGYDLIVGYADRKGDFGYSLSANISSYTNVVDALDNPDSRIFGYGSRVPSMTVTQQGAEISSFYGFKVLGIFQSQSEADAWAPYGTYNSPGKFKIEDTNSDGQINDSDRGIIGSPHPDYTYGINLNLDYKNWSLNVFGNGSQGNELFNYVRFFADFNSFQGNRSTRALRDAWQPSNPAAPKSQWTAANPNATSPIMDANDQTSSRVSTYLIEDGSYFRIKNIQLTYNFDDTINSLLGIAGGQVYLQAQNMITITDYSGLNPEIQTGADTTIGFDGGYMPVSKTVMVGLNINL